MEQAPIVSFHPSLNGDINRLLVSQRPLDAEDAAALQKAAAVVLPRPCRRDLYQLVVDLAKPHFPRYTHHHGRDGKVGNFLLLKELGLPQPKTLVFDTVDQAVAAWAAGSPAFAGLGQPPYYIKGAGGGEGKNVFMAATPAELAALPAAGLETICLQGPPGLVIQERVITPGRDARVIFLGPREFAFWKVTAPGEYRSNQKRGGRVDWEGWPDELARARQLARRFRDLAGLDVAAIDILVPENAPCLLLELNYVFGMLVLGGMDAFARYYLEAVRHWLAGLGLDPNRVQRD